MNKLRVGCSPITKTIYAGRVNDAGDMWSGKKHDVTNDVIGAIIEKIGSNNKMVISEDGVPVYEISVRALKPE